jgi:hypothetical protein
MEEVRHSWQKVWLQLSNETGLEKMSRQMAHFRLGSGSDKKREVGWPMAGFVRCY